MSSRRNYRKALENILTTEGTSENKVLSKQAFKRLLSIYADGNENAMRVVYEKYENAKKNNKKIKLLTTGKNYKPKQPAPERQRRIKNN